MSPRIGFKPIITVLIVSLIWFPSDVAHSFFNMVPMKKKIAAGGNVTLSWAPIGPWVPSTTSAFLTLTNSGSSTSDILTVSYVSANPNFSIGIDMCNGLTLAPGGGCTVEVIYIGPGGPEVELLRGTDGTATAPDATITGDCFGC